MDGEGSSSLVVGAWIGACAGDGTRTAGLAILRPRARANRADAKTRELRLYQFLDTDRWANSEAALVQNAPAHVYIADGCCPEAELRKVEAALDAADIAHERVSRSAQFADGEALANLQRLSGDSQVHLEEVSARQCGPAAQYGTFCLSPAQLLSSPIPCLPAGTLCQPLLAPPAAPAGAQERRLPHQQGRPAGVIECGSIRRRRFRGRRRVRLGRRCCRRSGRGRARSPWRVR
jgi:hypothetical protein